MIGYVTLGSDDLERSARFYDLVLTELGAKRITSSDTFIAWANAPKQTLLSIIKPYDGGAATSGNGTMVAFKMESPEKVQSIYYVALAAGAADEGAPGPRGAGGFYGAYCRDLDSNKLAFYCYQKKK